MTNKKPEHTFSLKLNTFYKDGKNDVYFVLRQIEARESMGEWLETYELYSVKLNENIIYYILFAHDFEEIL